MIPQATLPKLLPGAGRRVQSKVVERKNFIQMRQIVFWGVRYEISLNVIEGSEGASVIEGFAFIRHNNQDSSLRVQNTLPLLQRPQRICNVLEHMGSED